MMTTELGVSVAERDGWGKVHDIEDKTESYWRDFWVVLFEHGSFALYRTKFYKEFSDAAVRIATNDDPVALMELAERFDATHLQWKAEQSVQ